jgi:hypothetical protein
VTQAPPTPLSKLRKPRQLSQSELDARFPIDCVVIAATREVRVNPQWERDNLVKVAFPASFGFQGTFKMHKGAADQFKAWFSLISEQKLFKHIISNNGSYNPRLKRGDNVPLNKYGLSRHARGLALDLNAAYNPMGRPGAKLGEPGCILELIPLANECGIVAGADWHGASQDSMHFELGTFDP